MPVLESSRKIACIFGFVGMPLISFEALSITSEDYLYLFSKKAP